MFGEPVSTNRRGELRYKCRVPAELVIGTHRFSGELLDVSRRGARFALTNESQSVLILREAMGTLMVPAATEAGEFPVRVAGTGKGLLNLAFREKNMSPKVLAAMIVRAKKEETPGS